jgi:hypothetical protein
MIEMCAELGAPGGTRTPDQELRRLLLYPTELQAPDTSTIVTERSALVHGPAEAVDHLGARPRCQHLTRNRQFRAAHPAADHREG